MSISDRIPEIYAKGIRKQTKFYYANWLPTQEIMIGVVGELVNNHFFRPLTTLADLGIDFNPDRDILPDPSPSTLDLVSNRGVKINFKAAGSVNPNVPTVPTAKAGLGIEFSREASFVLKADKVFEPRIRDVEGLGRKIIEAYRAGKWKWYYKLVYSIVEAPYADIFISKSANSKVELEVTADGNLGKVELGNPEIKFGITSESGNVLKMPGSENCHPMFRLIGIKKNVIFDRIKFEPFGAEATGVAPDKPNLEDDTPYLSVGEEYYQDEPSQTDQPIAVQPNPAAGAVTVGHGSSDYFPYPPKPTVRMDIKPAIFNDFPRSGQPEYTGRYLVSIREGAGIKEIKNFSTDLRVESFEDLGAPDAANFVTLDAAVQESGGVLLKHLGIAIIKGEPQQLNVLSAAADTNNPFLNFEPERVVYAIGDLSAQYLKGYRDAVNHLFEKTLDGPQEKMAAETIVPLSTATWGLQVTNVIRSRFSGRGVNVAVLDTGFFHDHPDFQGRTVVSKSFIEGETAEDVHGHGSHCVGTALGSLNPLTGPRYGVAYNANIFVGKVLSNAGRGTDGSILAGIEWAVTNKCRIISMSLGAPTRVGQRHSSIFEAAAARAMAAGTLIIAAAGNNSSRVKAPVNIASVAHPANCPSVMAVAALDAKMGVAEFSCAGLNLEGGQVDISGPGVDVLSAWVPPSRYNTISGTSMATPHVAGVAALLAEANTNASASDLWLMLTKNARRLPLPSTDIGSGLVFLPV